MTSSKFPGLRLYRLSVNEVQDVYRPQGVKINGAYRSDRPSNVAEGGNLWTVGRPLLKGEQVDRKIEFDEANLKAVNKEALNVPRVVRFFRHHCRHVRSSPPPFQETTRVPDRSPTQGKRDNLVA
jgi:DNA-directed RNA polymerase subunit beta'